MVAIMLSSKVRSACGQMVVLLIRCRYSGPVGLHRSARERLQHHQQEGECI